MDPTDFPYPWVHELLQKLFGDGSNRAVKMKSYKRLGDNTGYLSDIFRTVLTCQPPCPDGEGQEVPSSVVLKIASGGQSCEGNSIVNDPAMRDTFESKAFIDCMHTKECMVYDWFKGFPEMPLPVPKCYAVLNGVEDGGPNIVILEDLSRNSGQQDIVEGLTLEQLENYVRCLSKFHAFLFTEESWKTRNMHFGVWEYMQTFIPAISVMIDRLKQEFPDDFTVDTAILKQMNDDKDFWKMEFGPFEGGYVPVLCHGDMWTYNLMFRTKNTPEADPEELSGDILSFIDWQWTCVGSVTQDLARLMSSSVAVDIRRENTTRLLKMYYDLLAEGLRARGQAQPPFSWEDLLVCWRRSAKGASLLAMIDLPMAGVTIASAQEDGERKAKVMVKRNVAFVEDAFYEKF